MVLKNDKLLLKKEFLFSLFSLLLILSNIFCIKIITIGNINISGGIFCYALMLLVSDIINENYGAQSGKELILTGFILQIFYIIFAIIIYILPGLNNSINLAFNNVIKLNFWAMVASLFSYLCTNYLDFIIFHKLRASKKWVRNNISTIISQIADSIIYTIIAFGIGQNLSSELIINIIISHSFIKIILALLDTPLFYLFTNNK